MNKLYEVACTISDPPPMPYHEWKLWHEWPYEVLSNRITSCNTITDVGAGCGFLSMWLLMSDKCERVIAYDTRVEMCRFMDVLSQKLGLSNRIDIRYKMFENNNDEMVVSTRLGFSNILLSNKSKTITLARTNECEPLFKYVETPIDWNEELVYRDDGFALRVLWNYQK